MGKTLLEILREKAQKEGRTLEVSRIEGAKQSKAVTIMIKAQDYSSKMALEYKRGMKELNPAYYAFN
jgi:hypothetical protein